MILGVLLIPIFSFGFFSLLSQYSTFDVEAWYSSSWTYRRTITVSGNGVSDLTNEDVLVVLDTATLVAGSKLQSDYDDLRFVDADDTTLLSYWIEGGWNTSTTHIWVRIPLLPTAGKTIYVYYGNALETTNVEQSWTGKFILMKNSACDSGWTTESSSGGDFYQTFPKGAGTYGGTGGSASHSHTDTSLSTSSNTGGVSTNKSAGNSVADNHSHSVTISTTSTSILPPYLDMIVCSNTDLIVKQNQVALFSATAPTGFTRFSALDSKLPRGNSTYGGSSTTTTHTHPSGATTTGGPSVVGTCVSGTTYVSSGTHTHTVSGGTTGTGAMMPSYLTMIYGQADADIMAPSGTITMTNVTPPLGWTRFSALDSSYPYGSTTYGTTGGSTTHTHTVSLGTSGPSASVGCGTAVPRTTRDDDAHTHSISSSINAFSNDPPYIETLFIQKKTSLSLSVGTEEVLSGNQAPSSPTNLLAEGVSNPTRVTDLTPEFSATYTDPDSDDSSAYQIQVNTQSDFLGTTMWDSTKTSVTITSGNTLSPAVAYGNSNLSFNGTTYYWRIKFWDDSDAEGNWSVGPDTFQIDAAPGQPTNLTVEGATNPVGITEVLPEFQATFNDSDGDNGTQYQIQVNTTSTFDGTSMWDSALQSMTSTANGTPCPIVTYDGLTLSLDGTTYYWRIKFADEYGIVGEYSSGTNTFRMNTIPGLPTDLTTEQSTNPTGVIDTLPEFSAIFNDADGDNGTQYQIEVNTTSDFNVSNVVWDSGLQSMTSTANGVRSPEIPYGGTALPLDGRTYYWRIKFADEYGTVSSWSTGTNTFTMNTAPDTPTVLLTEGVSNPPYLNDLTPEFSAIFTDANGDTATHYQIQVNTNSTFSGTTLWDSTKLAFGTAVTNGNRTPDISYAGTTLTYNDVKYYWRIKFWDDKGSESPWSLTTGLAASSFEDSVYTGLAGLAFSSSGLKLYAPNFAATSTINQYSISRAFELGTVSNLDYAINIISTPQGIRFKPDGTKMYLFDGVMDYIRQYTLSTAWDISSYSDDSIFLNINSPENDPNRFTISNDGTKVYVIGATSYIYQYNCLTAWDMSSCSYSSLSFNTIVQDSAPQGITFNDDGDFMYITGYISDTIFQYTLSTAWDISTAVYASKSFYVGTQDTTPTIVVFSPEGSKMYLIANSDESIYQYTLSTPWDLEVANFTMTDSSAIAPDTPIELKTEGVSNPTSVTDLTPEFSAYYSDPNGNSAAYYEIEVNTAEDFTGTVMWDSNQQAITISNNSRSADIPYGGTTLDYTGTTYYWRIRFWDTDSNVSPWSEVKSTYSSKSYSVSGRRGLFFSPNGTKMYAMMDGAGDEILYEYNLSVPWDVSTASYNSINHTFTEDSNGYDIYISPDGTKLYLLGYTYDRVHQYTLSTPWDLSTISYASKYASIGDYAEQGYGLFFKSDGTEMYISTLVPDDSVVQYSLSTPWDVSTASYDSEKVLTTGATNSFYGLFLKSDSTKMLLADHGEGNGVLQFTMSTAGSITTASYDDIYLDTSSEELYVYCAFVNPDANYLYILGSNTTVYQYSFSDWDINFATFSMSSSAPSGASVTFEKMTLEKMVVE